MRSLHDVSDGVVAAVCRDTQREALDAIVRNSRILDQTVGPACLRCYMRGVALHPTLGMCEACCRHEGVTR